MSEQSDKMQEIMETVAGLMALSARTAPKAKGNDFLEIKIIQGDALQILADGMVEHAQKSGKDKQFFARDGENVRRSEAVLLLSLKEPLPAGLNCGGCGFDRCSDFNKQQPKKEGSEFAGPVCAWRLMDLGIALGSAAKTASLHNADNRMMYTIGVVARARKLITGDMAVGIPLSASGKSIYFDR